MNRLLFTPLLLAMPSLAVAQTAKTDTVPVATYDLENLEVVATRKLITSDGAKLTYNVEEDPTSKGLTVSDALRKVPMVSVDGEGNIRINGDSNFKIFINGKEDPSLTSNYKDLFKSMPAETIVKVEVITEPGAKYDAEGTGGILNLITIRKNATDGYSGSVNLGVGLRQTYAGANARMRKGKFAVNGDVTYANNGFQDQTNRGVIETENFLSPVFRRQKDLNKQYIGFNMVQGDLGMSYDLSDRDLLTASASYNLLDGTIYDKSRLETSVFNENGGLTAHSNRAFSGKLKQSSLFADASWQHNFNDRGNNLVLSYRFSHGTTDLNADIKRLEHEGLELTPGFQNIHNKELSNEHTVQLDWTNPMAEGRHTVEAGAKAVWRHNPAESANMSGDSQQTATCEPGSESDITQFQDIYAAYATYKGTFGKLAAAAGLRYEHTRMGIDFHTGKIPDFTNRLNDIVPNASLTWMFGPASNLRLAYQMRISRPSLSQVNPFRLTYMPQQVQTGNPDLKSARNNKLTLVWSSFGRTLGGNIGVEYSIIDNAILPYAFMENDVMVQTYANIGHNKSAALNGMFTWTIIPGMQLMFNGRLANTRISTSSPAISNRGWTFNGGGSWNYTLRNKIRLSAYAGGQTKIHQLQGYSNGYYYYGVGINRAFLRNDALTVGLSANGFLTPEFKFRSFVQTERMSTLSTYYNKQASVNLNIGWNFGNLKQGVKKTNSAIVNDDVDASSKSGLM